MHSLNTLCLCFEGTNMCVYDHIRHPFILLLTSRIVLFIGPTFRVILAQGGKEFLRRRRACRACHLTAAVLISTSLQLSS